MAILDGNGTVNTVIGIIYDGNGTVNTQIGQVMDGNGTVNTPIYVAETDYFNNGAVVPWAQSSF